MNIDIKKNGNIKLKDTPYFEPIDNTDISFSNMDIDTAMITFQIKKNGLPLQVSKKNVYVYCYLESRNGTRSEVIELDVVDALQGKASLQLDSEFLLGATNSTVDGQLYITMHKWNRVDSEFSDTVALQRFTFTVKDALINEISGVTKTEYIRTFDQLRTEIKDKVQEMEENIGNVEEILETVNTAASNAINKVNDARDQMVADMQTKYDSTEADIVELRETSITTLNNAAQNYINDIKNAKDDLLTMIDENHLITSDAFIAYKEDFMEEIEERLKTYEDFVNATKDEFKGIVDALDWQKYKLTEDDGSYPMTLIGSDLEAYRNLPVGNYYTTGTPIADKSATSTAGFTRVEMRDKQLKHITYRPYNSNQIWLMRFYNTWNDWEIINKQSDTGWIPFDIINGGRTNPSYGYGGERNGYGCAYRAVTNGTLTQKFLRVNADTIVHNQVIAQLPKDFAKSPQVGFVRAPLDHNGTSIIIERNGEVKVYIANEKDWEASNAKYIYGEIRWED